MKPPPFKKFADEDEEGELEEEEEEEESRPVVLVPKKKWDDEEEDEDVLDSWEAADDSEEERKKAVVAAKTKPATAPKKSIEQRIAEKKAVAALSAAEAASAAEAIANETPAQRRARMQTIEVESDLAHATDLFGTSSIDDRTPTTFSGKGKDAKLPVVDPKDPSRTIDLSALNIFHPDSIAAFERLRDVLIPLISNNTKKPGYNIFCQDFSRAITKDLSSEQIRQVASKLTTLANEKLKEEKAAEKGGKKKGGKVGEKKNTLAATGKETNKLDTTNYDDSYDDFDDFM